MKPQSILIGQIIVVFTTIILITWYATQWVAGALAFDPYLGDPWFVLGNYKVYSRTSYSSGGIHLKPMRRMFSQEAARSPQWVGSSGRFSPS